MQQVIKERAKDLEDVDSTYHWTGDPKELLALLPPPPHHDEHARFGNGESDSEYEAPASTRSLKTPRKRKAAAADDSTENTPTKKPRQIQK
jgi:hypothetical protein